MCNRAWSGPEELLPDPELRLLGLQVYERSPDLNLLMFEHRCGSTVSVLARRLRHLVPDGGGAADGEVLYGGETCLGYCRTLEDLHVCERPCVNARDRRIVRLLLEMRGKRPGRSGP